VSLKEEFRTGSTATNLIDRAKKGRRPPHATMDVLAKGHSPRHFLGFTSGSARPRHGIWWTKQDASKAAVVVKSHRHDAGTTRQAVEYLIAPFFHAGRSSTLGLFKELRGQLEPELPTQPSNEEDNSSCRWRRTSVRIEAIIDGLSVAHTPLMSLFTARISVGDTNRSSGFEHQWDC